MGSSEEGCSDRNEGRKERRSRDGLKQEWVSG